MKRVLPTLLLPLCLHAKELEGVRAPAAGECPTVEEAAAKMKVPEGYEVRCFASEPMVVNPVAMTFDERGRLWVVELYEYPSGAKQAPVYSKLATDSEFRPVDREAGSRAPGDGKPRDRVKVLEDRDNDGIADKVTVFAEGLNLATGILVGHGGVYVGQAPNLLFFRDTNGDDVADEWKTVLTGFGLEDRHELLNGFTWGPDGWMYFTHGVFTNSRVRKPGAPADAGVKLDAGVGRVKPLTGEFEVFADGTSNPWGVDFDANGNAFVSACVIDHLFHLAPAGLYQRQGGTPEFPYAYGLLPSIVKHKHFRAAYAGVQVYQGWSYPEEMRGRILMGNIHDNAVHEEKLTAVGSTFRSEPVRDFLRAENGWFRPVSTQIGPDDNLWVMDWCDKYPCYQNAQANPEGVDRERGRIWRVVYTGGKPGAPVPSRLEDNLNLAAKDSASLFFLLQGNAHWTGRTARRLLSERAEPTLAPMLSNFVEHMRDNPARLPALWTLIASGAPPAPGFADKLTGDADPAVRLWTARWIGERRLESGVPALVKLAADPDPAVRLAVAAACRQFSGGQLTRNAAPANPTPVELEATLALTRASGNADPTLAHVIWMALQPRLADPASRALCLEKLAALPESAKPLSEDLVTKAVRMLCDRRDVATLDTVFRWTEGLSDPWVKGKAVEALVMVQEAGARKPGVDAGPSLAAWRASENPRLRDAAKRLAVLWGDPAAVAALVEQLGDAKAEVAARREALATLRRLKSEAARPALRNLVTGPAPDALRVEAVRFLADLGGDDSRDLLLSGWRDFPAPVRLAAADALVSREDWASALLDAVPAAIRAEDLPMTVRRFFGTTRSPRLVERAKARIGVWRESDEDTRRLIEAKRKAVQEGKPDLARGRQLFETTCATCHSFLGKGQAVGPDLTGSGRSNLDALLANLIDPNQIIGRGYENMLVRTKDGRTLGGRMVENTPGHVKLLNIGGAEQIVARDQIDSIEDTGLSLMPAGFGQLPDDALRDLVWFVLAPPEEGDLTPAKREELVKGVDPRPTEPKPAAVSGKRLDWEAAALWNPDWKIDAVSFEETPTVIAEHHDRRNVLMLHPKQPGVASALERTLAVPVDRALRLRAVVSSRKGHDWDLRVVADGKELRRVTVDHRTGAWTVVEVPLDEFKGKTVRLRLENVPTGWSWEFSYWGEVKVE